LTLPGSATPLRLSVATTSGGLIILLIVAVLAFGFPKVCEYRIAEYR
jgi:hypothetical protein